MRRFSDGDYVEFQNLANEFVWGRILFETSLEYYGQREFCIAYFDSCRKIVCDYSVQEGCEVDPKNWTA